jgi:2-succinyl-5-enolpyruvyl-6-hydroxy-3-cyclohexene-1-carboxylate synthase
MTTPGFPLATFARVLVGVLEHSGVEHLVVSPGSRSTPYVLAARRCSTLRLIDIIDERSAGFVALGLSRGTRRPVALLCTSGTAAANYLPALIEARLTGTPLVVLTADRPVFLQDCAAPQTVDQVRLFGHHVVGSWSLSPPAGTRAEYDQLRRTLLTALALATGPTPGPVHFNLHSDKPLEVVEPSDDDDRRLALWAEESLDRCPSLPEPSTSIPSASTVRDLSTILEREPRGIIACGFDPEWPPLDGDNLARLAECTGYPVLLDASHPLRFSCSAALANHVVAPFEPLLRLDDWKRNHAPRVILQIGRALTCAKWTHWLEAPQLTHLLLVSRRGWPDPTGRGKLVAMTDPDALIASVVSSWSIRSNGTTPPVSGWKARWLRASAVGHQAIERVLGALPHSTGAMDEVAAVHDVLDAIPRGTRLVLGNSLPVRHADLLSRVTVVTPDGPGILSEAMRGASGIDGVTSTAIGFARSDGRPTTLLLGDVSFLHDVGGLWAARDLQSPLAIVVVNNGGGRIFEQLPVKKATTKDDLAYWTTPHQLDLSHAAALYGLRHVRVENRGQVADALSGALSRSGTSVIELVVEPNSASVQTQSILTRVRDALIDDGLIDEARSDRSE